MLKDVKDVKSYSWVCMAFVIWQYTEDMYIYNIITHC